MSCKGCLLNISSPPCIMWQSRMLVYRLLQRSPVVLRHTGLILLGCNVCSRKTSRSGSIRRASLKHRSSNWKGWKDCCTIAAVSFPARWRRSSLRKRALKHGCQCSQSEPGVGTVHPHQHQQEHWNLRSKALWHPRSRLSNNARKPGMAFHRQKSPLQQLLATTAISLRYSYQL